MLSQFHETEYYDNLLDIELLHKGLAEVSKTLKKLLWVDGLTITSSALFWRGA